MKKAVFPALLIGAVVLVAVFCSSGNRGLQAQEGTISDRVAHLEMKMSEMADIQKSVMMDFDERLRNVEYQLGISGGRRGERPRPPERGRSRIGSNEASALGSLKAICTGQEQFKSANCVDQNTNGVGEYGFLEELGGRVKCRNAANEQRGAQFRSSPYIPSILGNTDTAQGTGSMGIAEKAGYCFRLFLPTQGGSGGTSTCPGLVNVPIAEGAYIVYAWPKEAGVTGNRVFVIDPQGQPYAWANKEKTYSGREKAPDWDAAFHKSGTWMNYIDDAGPGQTGKRGTNWVPVG